ncbi:hypothetical protein PanWU01x14_282900 [Parasponia andersonii]|uniref:Uncharacterized protein n=1 Tax=Parasponia andersonii TaxID=3476 RepID=A0A2P5B0M8_PARAD|nr:hypothetical protein PanWU01x14_282900 [Parasponia andersonii]
MTRLKPSSIFIASPETYNKASVRSIGYEQLTSPYWSYSIQWFITETKKAKDLGHPLRQVHASPINDLDLSVT